jgi:hypothetical protein
MAEKKIGTPEPEVSAPAGSSMHAFATGVRGRFTYGLGSFIDWVKSSFSRNPGTLTTVASIMAGLSGWVYFDWKLTTYRLSLFDYASWGDVVRISLHGAALAWLALYILLISAVAVVALLAASVYAEAREQPPPAGPVRPLNPENGDRQEASFRYAPVAAACAVLYLLPIWLPLFLGESISSGLFNWIDDQARSLFTLAPTKSMTVCATIGGRPQSIELLPLLQTTTYLIGQRDVVSSDASGKGKQNSEPALVIPRSAISEIFVAQKAGGVSATAAPNCGSGPGIVARDVQVRALAPDFSPSTNAAIFGYLASMLANQSSWEGQAAPSQVADAPRFPAMPTSGRSEITAQVVSNGAYYINILGSYEIDENNNIIPTSPKLLWMLRPDATLRHLESSEAETAKLLTSLPVPPQPFQVRLGSEAVRIGFFLTTMADEDPQDGLARSPTNIISAYVKSHITEPVSSDTASEVINSRGELRFENVDGRGFISLAGERLLTPTFFSENPELDSPCDRTSDIPGLRRRSISAASTVQPSYVFVAFEDLCRRLAPTAREGAASSTLNNIPPDYDYNDAVIAVDLGTVPEAGGSSIAANLNILVSDSLEGKIDAVIVTVSGLPPQDQLFLLPQSDGSIVASVSRSSDTARIVLVGPQSAERFQEFIKGIQLRLGVPLVPGSRDVMALAIDAQGVSARSSARVEVHLGGRSTGR